MLIFTFGEGVPFCELEIGCIDDILLSETPNGAEGLGEQERVVDLDLGVCGLQPRNYMACDEGLVVGGETRDDLLRLGIERLDVPLLGVLFKKTKYLFVLH